MQEAYHKILLTVQVLMLYKNPNRHLTRISKDGDTMLLSETDSTLSANSAKIVTSLFSLLGVLFSVWQ
jgi:hypothetical protein